jgi:hypothetical protein
MTTEPGSYRVLGNSPSLWVTRHFAESWFQDALREARSDSGTTIRDALRREILFSVCFVESYLLEWTRDEALSGDYGRLVRYFPEDSRRGICERWKKVLGDLFNDGLLLSKPDFNTSVWSDFW